MALRAEERKAEIIDGLLAQLGGRLPAGDAALAHRFVRLFSATWHRTTWSSATRSTSTAPRSPICASARSGGRASAKLRVYNPKLEQHGWQSTHTVVEIVNDDMPFLVDSVGMELNRHGLGIHLIIHPVVAVRRDAHGRLLDLGARATTATARARASCTSRSTGRATRAPGRGSRRDLRRVLARRAPRGRRLAGDARQGRRGHRPS